VGQIFFGWDGRLTQSFFGTSGLRYRHIQESFYPGRTVFSRKIFFFLNMRTKLQGGKSRQYDESVLTFFHPERSDYGSGGKYVFDAAVVERLLTKKERKGRNDRANGETNN